MHLENEFESEPISITTSLYLRIYLHRVNKYSKRKMLWAEEIATAIAEECTSQFGRPVWFQVRIEKGSIVVYVIGGVVAICTFLSAYGGIRSGLSTFSKDVTFLYKKTGVIIKRIIGHKDIKEVIEEKIQLGPIAAVDELLQMHVKGQISEAECTDGLAHVFGRIENSDDKASLITVAMKYIDSVYGHAYNVERLMIKMDLLDGGEYMPVRV